MYYNTIIDIGSNSTKLFKFKNLDIINFKSYTTKLITYLKNDNLTNEGFKILDNSLQKLLKNENTTNIHILATYTLRKAKNKEIIKNMLYKYTNKIYILSPFKEALYTHIAICNENNLQKDNFLSINLGGGSFEIFFKNFFKSYNIGVLNYNNEKDKLIKEIKNKIITILPQNYKIYLTGSIGQYLFYLLYKVKQNPCFYNNYKIEYNDIIKIYKLMRNFSKNKISDKFPFLLEKELAFKNGITILVKLLTDFNYEIRYSCANITLGYLIYEIYKYF